MSLSTIFWWVPFFCLSACTNYPELLIEVQHLSEFVNFKLEGSSIIKITSKSNLADRNFDKTLLYESKTIFKLSFVLLNVAKAAKIWVNVRESPKYLNKSPAKANILR